MSTLITQTTPPLDAERVRELNRSWRALQEARKAESLTEDFPVSQGPKADQWKADV